MVDADEPGRVIVLLHDRQTRNGRQSVAGRPGVLPDLRFAGLDLEEPCRRVRDVQEGHAVEIRLTGPPVVRVADQVQLLAFDPVLEHERSRPDRLCRKPILADLLDVLHRQDPRRRLGEGGQELAIL